MTYAARFCLVLAALAAGPGCSFLSPQGNPTQYYLLGGGWAEEEEVEGRIDPAGWSIGLRGLRLAAYLETPRIVVRQGPHEIRFAEFHRWGEDLDRGINRAVAGYLAAGPAVDHVDVVPWSRRAEHDVAIQLRVLRFEGVALEEEGEEEGDGGAAPEGQAHLLITWEISAPETGEVLVRGKTDYLEDGWRVGDYGALAMMLDTGLQALAAELTAYLETLLLLQPEG